MHGGATPRGADSPHYKHGLYSRYAAGDLADRISELRQEEDRLHDLREVMAVQGALLGEALQQGDLGAASALTEAVSRSIDRYHKHNPPEDGIQFLKIERRIVRPGDIHVTFGDDLADVAAIDSEIDRLLAARHKADPNTITIIDKVGDDPAEIKAGIDTLLERLHKFGKQHPLEQDTVTVEFPPRNP